MTKVVKGDKVRVEYTGTFQDGSVFDKSEGRGPLKFTVGKQQVVPGFDKAIEGMNKDQEKTFTLKPEEAYGEIKAEMVQVVPRDKLPEKPEPEVGMMLVMQAPTGQQIPAKITKVEDGNVTIDINHPLAGKELTFKVKVTGINDPEDLKEKEGCCSGGSCGTGEDKKDCGDGSCGDGSCSDKEDKGGCGSGGCGHEH